MTGQVPVAPRLLMQPRDPKPVSYIHSEGVPMATDLRNDPSQLTRDVVPMPESAPEADDVGRGAKAMLWLALAVGGLLAAFPLADALFVLFGGGW